VFEVPPFVRFHGGHLTAEWWIFNLGRRMGHLAQIMPKTYRQIMASDSQHSATEFYSFYL